MLGSIRRSDGMTALGCAPSSHRSPDGWVLKTVAFCFLVLLCACGGGGGGGSTIPPQSPPPSTPLSITTTAIPDGTTGTPYSFQFNATGGSGSYSWQASGQLFSLTFTSNGLLSGTSQTNGTSNLTVSVTDTAGHSASKTLPFRMLAAYNWNGQTTAATAHLNAPYSLNLVPTPSAAFQVTAGALPPGLHITGSTASGWQISGTPTSTGTFQFTLQGSSTDTPPQLASQAFTITVDSALAFATPSQLPDAVFGTAYSVQLATVNAIGAVTWSVTGLPLGLSLDPQLGTISGNPAWGLAVVDEVFGVTATDSSGKQVSQQFGIIGHYPISAVIASPSISLNRKVSDSIVISGGAYPFTVSIISGVPPTGLSLNKFNNLSGTPTQLGAFNFTVQIADSSHPQNIIQVPLSVTVVPPTLRAGISWNSSLFSATPLPVGVPFVGYVEPSGGLPPYTFSSAPPPPGITLDAHTGVFSGTPTTPGDYNPQVVVTDSANASFPLNAFFHVVAGQARNDDLAHATLLSNGSYTASISPFQDPDQPDHDYYRINGIAGSFVQVLLSPNSKLIPVVEFLDSNGTRFAACSTSNSPPYTSPCIVSGHNSSFPNLLLLLQVPGSTGTPVPVYAHIFDWRGDARPDMLYTLAVSGAVPPLTISVNPTSAIGVVGRQFFQSFQAFGGAQPYSWSIVSGNLPAGLSFANGTITGIPTTTGSADLIVQVADASGPPQTAQQPYHLDIYQPVVINPATLPNAKVGVPYQFQFTATGGAGPPYSWGYIYGFNVTNFVNSDTAGVMQFTPTQAGSFMINITASSNFISQSINLPITIDP